MGYYRKRYRRSVTSVNSDKYSVERTAFFASPSAVATTSIVIVPSTAVRGMRKVKHLNISLTGYADNGGNGLYWAIVYVPEGYTPQSFNVPTSENPSVDLYAANQFVMSAGVVDFDAGPQRISSPLSRNLNSGDSIVLLLRSTVGNVNVNGVVKYAITLQ